MWEGIKELANNSYVPLACDAVTVVAFFVPPLTGVAGAVRVASTVSKIYAGYNFGKSAVRLGEKFKNGEEIMDAEGIGDLLNIFSASLGKVSSHAKNVLTEGAKKGLDISTSMKIIIDSLNATKLGFEAMELYKKFEKIIEKNSKGTLTKREIAEIALACFLFSKSCWGFKLATKMIREAQNEYFKDVAKSFKNKRASKAFSEFVEKNTASGSVEDSAKLIRTINKMNDPEKLFMTVGPNSTVKILDDESVKIIDKRGHIRKTHTAVCYSQKKGKPLGNFDHAFGFKDGPIEGEIFSEKHFKKIIERENGISTKFYTNKENYFGVKTSTPDGSFGITFKKLGVDPEKFVDECGELFKNNIINAPNSSECETSKQLIRYICGEEYIVYWDNNIDPREREKAYLSMLKLIVETESE